MDDVGDDVHNSDVDDAGGDDVHNVDVDDVVDDSDGDVHNGAVRYLSIEPIPPIIDNLLSSKVF